MDLSTEVKIHGVLSLALIGAAFVLYKLHERSIGAVTLGTAGTPSQPHAQALVLPVAAPNEMYTESDAPSPVNLE